MLLSSVELKGCSRMMALWWPWIEVFFAEKLTTVANLNE